MKVKVFGIVLVFLLSLCFSSCVTRVKPHQGNYYKGKTIPPGQAKKMTGSKSAKQYAPGHNK